MCTVESYMTAWRGGTDNPISMPAGQLCDDTGLGIQGQGADCPDVVLQPGPVLGKPLLLVASIFNNVK